MLGSPPKGILETSLYVSDVERATRFYQRVLGLRRINEDSFAGGRGAAFQVGDAPNVLLLFDATITRAEGILPSHGSTGNGHIAFRIEPNELDAWRQRILEHGISIEKEFAFGNNPPSLYFRDPDGNLLEIAVASIWDLHS